MTRVLKRVVVRCGNKFLEESFSEETSEKFITGSMQKEECSSESTVSEVFSRKNRFISFDLEGNTSVRNLQSRKLPHRVGRNTWNDESEQAKTD